MQMFCVFLVHLVVDAHLGLTAVKYLLALEEVSFHRGD